MALGRRIAWATGSFLVVAHISPHRPGPPPERTLESRAEEELRRDASGQLSEAEATPAGFERWEPHTVDAIRVARGLLDVAAGAPPR